MTDVEKGCLITCAYGAVALPAEASDPSSALRLADERLYAQKRNVYRGPSRSYKGLVKALTAPEQSVGEYATGVCDLSAALAARLGMSGRALVELKLAAELHDIGKLATTQEPLVKPGVLSEAEWQFVREHTVIGRRILAGAPAARAVGQIVRLTPERWDGAGYVDGVAAAAIPLAARVIAVCDAYASMVFDRSLREAMSPSAALAELRRRAGSQFDPEVVAAFADLLAEVVPAPPAAGLGASAAA